MRCATRAQAVSGAGSRGRKGAAPPQRLAPMSADIMRRFAPPHIRAAAPDARPALWAAVCLAFGVDVLLASDVVLGVRPVGDVPASESSAPEVEEAELTSLDEMDNVAWNSCVVRDVTSRAGKARSTTGCVVSRDLEAIFMVCEKEVSRGYMHGYF